MVETRRKKAAAAQDGAVKENKAEPPAPQTQTPTKRGRRGRPPKNRPEASTPSTSGPTDVSNLEQKDDASSMKLLKDCESSNDSVLNSNEADSFLEKEDDAEAAPSQKKVKKEIVSPEKANHSPIPPPPPLSKRRSSAKIKIKKEPVEQVPVAELETTEAPVERAKTPEAAPPSPPHPEDPQPSATVSMKNEPAQEKQEPVINHACESAQEKEPVAAVKNEPESEEPAPKIHNLTGPETTQEEGHASKASIPPLDPNKLMEDLINDSESMDIADSDSDNGDTAEARPSTSSTNMQQELNQNQIHVDVDHSLSVNVTGSASWEQQSEEKKPENPLSSPMRRPRIHFLHPAYQSFASDPVQVHASPQPPPPPEPAPIKETENGFSMGFKPMAFKSKLGPKTNPLMQAGTASNPIPPRPVATPAVVVPDSTTLPTTQFSPQKRNTNFGSSASNLPPPTMVDLPKLSFFNMPSSNSVESDSPSKEPAEKPPKPACASILPAAPRISDAKIYALKAKTERIAQDIARRHHVDRQKEEREDHDRRREERERRHKKAEEESKQRQREDDKRRARDRELRRKEREKEEERMQAQRDLERKQKEEESKIREQERKAREEERRAKEEERKKEEEKRIREEDMKVPPYEKIDECKFLMRNAHKKKTDSMICDCVHSNNNCSDGNCVNRAMQTECPSSCKAKCKNQRFAKRKYALVEAFHTGTSKGCGLRALKDIKKGRFIIEYVGEVVERDDYEKRKLRYAADKKHKHHYLCDTGVYTIDATVYGNDSRFVNHSCDPNAICEKWSVPKTPGDISRIGFFAKRNIMAGEEITFNYQFVNYGRDAQQCFCGASNCTGWIGQKPDQFSSDEEDDEDDPNRQIQIDEDLDERLEEDMYEMSGSEKIKYLDEELGSLASKSKKYARKVITIVSKMEDYEQRSNLLKSMFCQDIDYNTRMHYAKEGMSTLIGEWLEPVDFSLENLNLVKVCLQTLQTDGFTSCLKTNRFLIDTVNRWMNMTWNDWMDVQVVTDALVTCVADPTKEYSVVGEEFHNEITINLQRVKEMMVRLMKHCGAISFKIPKKARDQETKEGESKSQINVSSHTHESNRSGAISPYQRHHHSSSYYERDSHPRFFNNGNDVHQYRFGGYHGNNYKENYQRRISSRDSYRERRRPGRRSRSRSRSSSPQMYKRRKLEEREGRHRSPLYERRGGSPSARTPGSSASGERAAGKSESKLHAMSDASSSSLHAAAAPAAHGQPVPHVVAYPNTHDPNGHPVPVGYPVPGYEAYAGMVDANGMYVYHPSAGYYSSYHQHHGALTLENLPPFEKLNELYETATVNQLNERLHKAKKEVDLIKAIIARKLHEEQVVSTARMKAAEEARALEALNRSKYVWARAKSDTGETYYYNKVTKETQWSPPSAEQGLLDPNDRASPDTTVVAAEEPKPTVVEQPIVEPVFEVKMEPVEVPTSVEEASVDVNPSRDRERDRDRDRDRERDRDRDRERERDHGRDRDRDRREGSRHHEHSSQRHDGLSRDERRTRDFKTHLEKVVRSVVKVAIRDLRDATHDKTTWLIKMVTKEMYKRESQQPGFDCRFTEDSERKVRNYTKSLIDRKLKTDDLWKGYSEGR